ncbi:MAG: serine O-acetyltransferase EpsC [Clostridia bacterium]|jgi:serine O-acetyltransferase
MFRQEYTKIKGIIMFNSLKKDIDSAMQRDPAARSRFEVWLTYAGVKALRSYRLAHWLYKKKMFLCARIVSQSAARRTGIEIHPAAKIGEGLFIDHGHGIVIGETAEIGNNVTLYQGVTLGGTGKGTGKRHPTIMDNVMISAGAKILGPVTIGEGSKVGAGSVVLKDVPPHCTVVGVPGRVVRMRGEKFTDMDQFVPDPVLEEFARINKRLSEIEKNVGISACKYSISSEIANQPNYSTENDSKITPAQPKCEEPK